VIRGVFQKMNRQLRSRGHRFREPRFGLEIGPDGIRGVCLRPAGEGWRLDARAEVALPAGALPLNFRRFDVPDSKVLGAALSEVAGRLGARKRRVGVALPDALIKMRVETFPALPDDPAEARRLAAWRAGKRFGVSGEDLVVDLFPLGWNGDGEPEALVAAALRPVIRQYETLFGAAGLDSEPILPAAIARFNLHAADLPDEGTTILLIFTAGYFHLLRMEEGRLVRFQSMRGGLGDDRLGRDLFLVAEQLRDDLGDRKIDRAFLSDPGAPLWELSPALDGLFEAKMTILRPNRRLAEILPVQAEAPELEVLGAAIGAAVGAPPFSKGGREGFFPGAVS
jgi:hypothetical protein